MSSTSAHPSYGVHGPRIKLLTDLHRPLEEHWAGKASGGKKNGKGLDALGSDYMYKHHITSLEEIYKTKNTDPALGLGVDPLAIDTKNVSAQAQLYGIEGLLSPHLQPGYEQWRNKRESGWDPYMKVELPSVMIQKVSALAEKRVPPSKAQPQSRSPARRRREEEQRRPASASPVRAAATTSSSSASASMGGYSSPGPHNQQHLGYPTSAFSGGKGGSRRPNSASYRGDSNRAEAPAGSNNGNRAPPRRHRCDDPRVPPEHLILLGQYHLSTQQRQLYSQFVEMLLGFDQHDQQLILQDCSSDCRDLAMLGAYAGAGLSDL